MIKAGSIVKHNHSGEKWFLLGVNRCLDEICVAGYPKTIAKLSDCELIEEGIGISTEEREFRDKEFGTNWDNEFKTHELKTWPTYFQAIWDGIKPWEYRKDDRNYEVGDGLVLKEWDYNKAEYTGRKITANVPYLLRDKIFVPSGFVILTLDDICRYEI